MGQVGTAGNEKVSSIIIATSGDKLVVQFSDGDGILYEIIEDLVSPLRMIKTLSNDEIEKFKILSKLFLFFLWHEQLQSIVMS